jgi:hypothetical protein
MASGGEPRFWARAYASGRTRARFRYLECRTCGALFLWPRLTPEEQGAYYPTTYHPLRNQAERVGKGLVQLSTLLQMGLSSPSMILDWGCGQGELVEILSRMGLSARGFEPFRYAWPSTIAPLIVTTTDEALRAVAGVDVIVMLDVLEHIFEPVPLLKTIGENTRASIFVFCPRADGPEIRRFSGKAYLVQAPNHAWLPTRASLQSVAALSGWTVAPCPQPYTEFGELSWQIVFGGRAFAAQGGETLRDRMARRLSRLARRMWPPETDSGHLACILRKP